MNTFRTAVLTYPVVNVGRKRSVAAVACWLARCLAGFVVLALCTTQTDNVPESHEKARKRLPHLSCVDFCNKVKMKKKNGMFSRQELYENPSV
eukprot:1245047-Amphidinium_carterae.1